MGKRSRDRRNRRIRAAERRTSSQLLTVTMGPDNGTGYAEQVAVDATTIDAAAIGREAAGKARATADAVAVDPGDYSVVLEEYAVVDLLDMLGYLGFSALAVQEDRSFFERGKQVAALVELNSFTANRDGGQRVVRLLSQRVPGVLEWRLPRAVRRR